jgi:hypothetical protein
VRAADAPEVGEAPARVGGTFIWNDLVGKVPASYSLPIIALAVGVSVAVSPWTTRSGGPAGPRAQPVANA